MEILSVLLTGMFIAFSAAALFTGGFFFARMLIARDMQALLQSILPTLDASSNFGKLFNTLSNYLIGVEQQLNEAADRYRTLTQNIAAAVVIRDTTGKITYCNPYTEVLTGYPLKAIYQADQDFFSTICHESDRERVQRSLKITELGGEPFQFTFQFFHQSGISMWAEARSVPIADGNDDIIGSLSIILDVTASVRYQKQIEEKNKELKEITYMVSHDLKAPIVTIKGMIGAVEEDHSSELSEPLQEYMHHINQATNRLEHLVHSVLTYSKVSSAEIQHRPVQLTEVIQEVVADYQATLQQTQANITIVGEMPQVFGDKTQLYQVFSNLLGNALKYRDPGRVPLVSIRADVDFPHRRASVHVEDNGQGIPEEKIETIFRPFVRLHGNDIDGTGIGLACVKKLVERSGGSVTAQSIEGQGSDFCVHLRLAQ